MTDRAANTPAPSRAEFASHCRAFANGEIDATAFNDVVRAVLVQGPTLVYYGDGAADAIWPLLLDCAMHLDMVAAPGPMQDLVEARALAAGYGALLVEAKGVEFADSVVAELPVGVERTIERFRQFLDGEIGPEDLGRFIGRRPWSPSLMHAVAALSPEELSRFTAALRERRYLDGMHILGLVREGGGAA